MNPKAGKNTTRLCGASTRPVGERVQVTGDRLHTVKKPRILLNRTTFIQTFATTDIQCFCKILRLWFWDRRMVDSKKHCVSLAC